MPTRNKNTKLNVLKQRVVKNIQQRKSLLSSFVIEEIANSSIYLSNALDRRYFYLHGQIFNMLNFNFEDNTK